MTENDYIAEYVRERRPELITSFDYIGWKMCRILRETIGNIARAFSAHSGQEAEEKDNEEGEKDAQLNEEAAVRPEDQEKDL